MDDYGLFGLEDLAIKKRGTTWSFKQKEGILKMKKFDEEGDMGWQQVCNDYSGYFSFVITDSNEINFIYKNNEEQVKYLSSTSQGVKISHKMAFPEGENIVYQTLLASESKKQMILVFTEEENNSRWKIYSCIKESGTWMEPTIVDTGWGYGPGQGSVAIGKEGQIFLVYQKHYQGEYQVIYRVNKDKEWSEAVPIVRSKEFNFSPSLSIDNSGKPHLVWLRPINSAIRVMYTCKTMINSFWSSWIWQKEQIISAPGVNCISPTIIVRNDYPEIYWQVVDEVYTKVFCLKMADNKKIQVVAEYRNQKCPQGLLDLDKYPELKNYSGINGGSTLFFLLLSQENSHELSKGAVLSELDDKMHYRDADPREEPLKEKEKMEKLNARLQKTLLRKNEEFQEARNKWEEKEKVLEKEIDRLRQNLKAIQRVNEELRQRLKDKEIEQEKIEEREQNKTQTDTRKLYPHFPFIKPKMK